MKKGSFIDRFEVDFGKFSCVSPKPDEQSKYLKRQIFGENAVHILLLNVI